VRRRTHPRASAEAVEAVDVAAEGVEAADDATEAAVDAAEAAEAVADAVGTAQAVVDAAEEKRAEEAVEEEAVEMLIEAEKGVKGLLEQKMNKKGHSSINQDKLDRMEKGLDGAVAKVLEETANEEISELRVRSLSLNLWCATARASRHGVFLTLRRRAES